MNIYKDIIAFGFLNFYLEMLFAAVVCVRHYERREHFLVRLLACLAVGSLTYFLPFNKISIGPVNLGYFLVFALIAAEIFACMKISVMGSVFYAVSAFAFQNAAWMVMMIIFDLFGTENFSAWGGRAVYFLTFAVVYLVLGLLFPNKKFASQSRENTLSLLMLSAGIIFTVYILSALLSGIRGWSVYARIYALICCIFALSAQFGLFRNEELKTRNKQLETEKIVLEELLYQEKKRQVLTKESIEIIDAKCHDLKHQIAALRTMDEKEREERIGEIENAVILYGKIAKTSNEVLNVVLTEKGMICEKHKIRFTYMLDGDELSFLEPVDLSTLFGNAIDNAIECVRKEAEEYRVIKLIGTRKDNFLGVHFENYCSAPPEMKDGMPVTSKRDKNNHGFGMKSIRYIAEKYGGQMNISLQDNMFVLDILFPVKNQKEITIA